MSVNEDVVSYRNGPQVIVAGLQPSLRDMGYARSARVQITDPVEDPAHAPWVFVGSNDEHETPHAPAHRGAHGRSRHSHSSRQLSLHT
jgi:hypothetical protein